jgi:hypothetical protein
MRKYHLARMLEEVRRDERGGKEAEKKVLTQEEIKALARSRRKPQGAKSPPLQ